MINYYTVLGLSDFSSPERIKKRYIELAKKYHPDKNVGVKDAEKKFKAINEAFQFLKDEDKKAVLDQFLIAKKNTTIATTFSSGTTFTDHNRPFGQKTTISRTSYAPPSDSSRKLIKKLVLSCLAVILVGSIWFHYSMEKQTAKKRLIQGKYLFNIGDYVNADQSLRIAISKDPSLHEAHFFLGKLALEYFDQPQVALIRFNEAIKNAKQKNRDYFFLRGLANHKLEEYDAAIEDYHYAAYLDNKFMPPYIKLGDIFLYQKNSNKQAIDYYRIASSYDSLKQEALLGIGIAHQQNKLYDSAGVYFSQAEFTTGSFNSVIWFYQAFQKMEYEMDTLAACQLWQKSSDFGVVKAKSALKRYCD